MIVQEQGPIYNEVDGQGCSARPAVKNRPVSFFINSQLKKYLKSSYLP